MNDNGRLYTDDQPGVKVLCVDQFAHFGGGQRSLIDLLPGFSARGWRPGVALPDNGPFPDAVRHFGYETYTFKCGAYESRKKPLWQMLKYVSEIPRLVDFLASVVEESKADLLYVNGPRLVPSAAWVSWRKGIPMVFHCHNRLLQRSAVALTGQALELASAHVIACCQHAAEPFREYVEQQRLRVIYNGVPDMSADQRREQKIRTIGVIGRVELGKGQLEFVRAARIVLQAFPHCRFQVVGAPMFSSPKYYSKVAACSRAMPVEFLDWAEDMAKIYSELDLLVVPSSEVEATTRVILEAFSARVPVVAFPVGGIPEVLKDGETGFLTSALSVKALAARIISVLQMDQSKLAEVVEAARGEWQRRFTLAAYRARVCDLLASAMEPQSLGYGAVSEAAPVLTD